jgi:D-glycero-D-manno-heptose 1,7-bisphosphate phosphatase
MNKAIFIDRDGVINQLVSRDGGKYSPRLLTDFQIFPFVPGAIKQIREAGYLAVVVTNQPDISRGHLSERDLTNMHQLLKKECKPDAIYICPHDSSDECQCRKPRPGMLLQAALDLSIELKNSWIIGDRKSDIDAGLAAGVRTVFITSGQDDARPTGSLHSAENLEQAIDFIMSNSAPDAR